VSVEGGTSALIDAMTKAAPTRNWGRDD